MLTSFGDRGPSAGQISAHCFPYDDPGAPLSPRELKQRRLRLLLQPARARFSGGVLIVLEDRRTQVRLPLGERAADDPDFWPRVWAYLRVLAAAGLHAYDIQLERQFDLERDQEIVPQRYREVVEDIFAEDESEAEDAISWDWEFPSGPTV